MALGVLCRRSFGSEKIRKEIKSQINEKRNRNEWKRNGILRQLSIDSVRK